MSREIRSKGGEGVRYVIGLDVYGPKRYYSLSITPEREDDVSLQTARAVRDSFRAADTSVGNLQNHGREDISRILRR